VQCAWDASGLASSVYSPGLIMLLPSRGDNLPGTGGDFAGFFVDERPRRVHDGRLVPASLGWERTMSRSCGLLVVLLVTGFLAAQPRALGPDANTRRPIEALDTLFVEEMTWMEVRDALKAGKTTVIVPTGGVEQNGPYLATGKHDYILRATSEA